MDLIIHDISSEPHIVNNKDKEGTHNCCIVTKSYDLSTYGVVCISYEVSTQLDCLALSNQSLGIPYVRRDMTQTRPLQRNQRRYTQLGYDEPHRWYGQTQSLVN
jgi:hypothetical protein